MDVRDLKQALLNVEKQMMKSLASPSLQLDGTVEDLNKLTLSVEASRSHMADRDLLLINETATRIRVFASALVQLEDDMVREKACMQAEVRSAIESDKLMVQSRSVTDQLAQKNVFCSETTESIRTLLLRQYFLDHADRPYPTSDEKADLVRKTNEALRAKMKDLKPLKNNDKDEINEQNVSLWFVNARRRSGWQDIKARFAENSPQRIGMLARAVLRERGIQVDEAEPGEAQYSLARLLNPGQGLDTAESQQRIKDFKKAWEEMELYIREGTKEKAGEWIQQIVEGVKQERKPEKTRTTRKKERVASTAANKPKSKGKPKSTAENLSAKAATSQTPKKGTRTSARLVRSLGKTRGLMIDYTSSEIEAIDDHDHDDEEAPVTARPSTTAFADLAQHSDPQAYANALGLGLPSVLARGPPPDRRNCSNSSDGSTTSSSVGGFSTSDESFFHQRLSRTSSVSSIASMLGFEQLNDASAGPSTDKQQQQGQKQVSSRPTRPIKPLPGQSTRKSKPNADTSPSNFAELDLVNLVPVPMPIASSPTNSQEVHDKFINEQPSDSDSSPYAPPLLLPTGLEDFSAAYRFAATSQLDNLAHLLPAAAVV